MKLVMLLCDVGVVMTCRIEVTSTHTVHCAFCRSQCIESPSGVLSATNTLRRGRACWLHLSGRQLAQAQVQVGL